MKVTLRSAAAEDGLAILHIKEQLRLKLEDSTAKRLGGFLLGTSLAEYQQFIQQDVVLVAECDEPRQVVGFAVVMNHASLAQSALLQRAEQVQWETAFRTGFNAKHFAFFEQLGMLPDPAYRVYAKYLAFAITWKIFQTHEALFTTVLQYPFLNTAALSFINVVGFEYAGMVDEVYPDIGRVKSNVYHLERQDFLAELEQPKFRNFLARAQKLGYIA